MSWSINVSGEKPRCKEACEQQGKTNVENGYMSEAQVAFVQAAIDAAPGTHCSVSSGGHNTTEGASGSFSTTVSGYTP